MENRKKVLYCKVPTPRCQSSGLGGKTHICRKLNRHCSIIIEGNKRNVLEQQLFKIEGLVYTKKTITQKQGTSLKQCSHRRFYGTNATRAGSLRYVEQEEAKKTLISSFFSSEICEDVGGLEEKATELKSVSLVYKVCRLPKILVASVLKNLHFLLSQNMFTYF